MVLFFQGLTAAFTITVLKIFTRLEVYGAENLKAVKKPYIIATNHESHLDPELVGAVVFHYKKQLLPYYFMTKDSFFQIPVFGSFIKALGAFPAHKKEGIEKSLAIPTELLNSNKALIIFPEGHIVPERPALGEGRRGTAILGLTTDAEIIPMSLHTPANFTFWKFIFGRKKIVVRIGEPFRLDKSKYNVASDDQVRQATKEIMAKIGTLYHQHTY